MAFKVVKNPVHVGWFPISAGTSPTANTAYIGQIVKWQTGGILPIGAAAANPDVTYYPFGVVIGLNDREPVSDSTGQYGTAATTQALSIARDCAFQEGMFSKGDSQALALVALIDANTILEGPICNAARATAPGVVTCTTASSDGLSSMVHGSSDVTTVANNNMYYCRSGANAGLYRMSYAASQTTPTFYNCWPYDWAVGDTFCVTNVGLGRQLLQLDSTAMWVENSAALTSYYYVVTVNSMDLTKAGAETIQFRFTRAGY